MGLYKQKVCGPDGQYDMQPCLLFHCYIRSLVAYLLMTFDRLPLNLIIIPV